MSSCAKSMRSELNKYVIAALDAPYAPEKYVDLIREIVKLNYPILIIDSTSHEWEGKGGALELHQQAGGTYQAWSKVTPRHDKFILEIADSPIHIIATMRGKDQYSMETEGGRTTVKKLGVGAKQREGVEYEFTVTFLLDQLTNLATQKKDNTHINTPTETTIPIIIFRKKDILLAVVLSPLISKPLSLKYPERLGSAILETSIINRAGSEGVPPYC